MLDGPPHNCMASHVAHDREGNASGSESSNRHGAAACRIEIDRCTVQSPSSGRQTTGSSNDKDSSVAGIGTIGAAQSLRIFFRFPRKSLNGDGPARPCKQHFAKCETCHEHLSSTDRMMRAPGLSLNSTTRDSASGIAPVA